MKNGKRFYLLLLLCAAVLTLLCAAAAAESTDDGFQITDGVLTKYTGPGGDVTIPDGVTEIGSNAFENCKALTGIVIPDSVTKIGMNAFRGCTGLKEVTVPDGVTSIEDHVFYHCEAMERVSLPKGIVSIGHSSFEYCLKLTDIQLPSGLKSIDHSAFWACRSLVKLMLPQSLETIGNTSFGKCSAMNPLQVPETLKSIGEIGPEAPRFCCETGTDAAYVISKASTYNYFCEDGLMLRYTFDSKGEPDGGLVLNDYVGAKKEVLIPSDVTSINNEDIFKDRTDLVAIRFQGNTRVSTSYFTGCTAVIQCPAGYSNAVYLLQQQASSQLNIATYTGSTLMCYAGSLTELKLQNDWIYEIAADAFNGSSSDADSLETIILPAYLQHLLDGTFSDLDNLKEIYFGDELNQIGEKCFGERTAGELPKLYCTAGTKTARTLSNAGYTFLTPHVHTIVTQPAVEATYTEPGKTEGSYCSECGEVFTAQEDVPALGEKDFTFTTDDTGATVTGYTGENADVQLPSALGGKPVVAIGANAFNGNETITSVTMPDSVTVIGDYAFAYSSVTSITLSEGLTSLGENVFTDARWLTTIDDRSRNFVQTINGIHYNVAGTEIILCPADVAGDIQLPAGLLAVPEKCFEGLPKITSVTFPDSVKIIGAYAFKKCDNLTGVTLPKGLERLEEGLFLKCISLTNIEIPDKVTVIADNVFSGCNALSSVLLSNNITTIGTGAFAAPTLIRSSATAYARTWAQENGMKWEHDVHTIVTQPAVEATYTEPGKTEGSYCPECGKVLAEQEDVPALGEKDFTFTTDDTGATVTGYKGESTEVHIPSVLGGKPVTKIAEKAFYFDLRITGMHIPASVAEIEEFSFYQCRALDTITVNAESPYYTVEGNVLYTKDMTTLVRAGNVLEDGDLHVPSTVTYIAAGAFSDNKTLQELWIPASVQFINGTNSCGSFCRNFRRFHIDEGNTQYASPDGALYNRTVTQLFLVPEAIGTYRVPDSVTSIADCAIGGTYYGSTTTLDVTMPEKLAFTGDCMFSWMQGTVTFLNPKIRFGENCFMSSQDSVIIRGYAGSTAQTYAKTKGIQFEDIEAGLAFQYTTDDTGATVTGYTGQGGAVEIPSMLGGKPVVAIGDNAFNRNETITSVTLPDSVTAIGQYAFGYCDALAQVVLSENLAAIGASAFSGCYDLKTITLPEKLNTIGEFAFYFTRLTSIHIPASVAKIEKSAFDTCRDLDTITVDAENPYYTVEGNVLYTKDMTRLVRAGNVLEDSNFHVPSTVTFIDAGAFSDNKTLQELWIPASVETMDGNNICGTWISNFRRFHVDEKNEKYASPDGALYNRGMTQLYRVPEAIGTYRVPDSVTSIADFAIGGTFYDRTVTLDVTMPEGLAFTGNNMFNWMRGTVTFLNPQIQFGQNCFIESRDTMVIRGYVGSTAQTYAEANGLQFESIEETEFQYTVDDTGATVTGYTGQGGTMEIPSMLGGKPVVAIGDNAFNGNETITSVTMLDSVTTIGQRAFYDCKALKQLTLPENLTDIGAYAFSGCTALQNVTLPGKLATIAERAFDYTALTAIHIPASVTMIGQRALSQNYDLLKITVDETNNVYCAEDNVLYNKEKTKLIRAGSGLSGDWSIPFGVKTVEAMAFWNCWTLETLRIPATVQSIGQIDMLGGCCEKLSAIVVDAANPVYSSLDGALCSKDGTVLYYLPENIGTYTVPDSVTRIANGAIQFTTSRQEGLNLTLPESLSMIEDGNFSFIHGVFTFLNPNLKIGSDWFMDCNAEKVVIRGYAGSTAQALAEEKNFAFEDLTISAQFQYTVDDTGTTITGYTGQGGTVEIPSILGGKPVVAIGNNAFQMPNLEIRTDITAVILPEGLQSIGRSAFWGCAGITSIEIPDSVTEIGWAAFETCENLTSVTLPKNLTQISDSLFHNCPLTEIDLPQGITRIGDYAFRDTGLTAIVIPEGTLSIGKCAFEGCSELSAVTIPASVTEVGECAFANCPKLAPLDEILPEKLTKVIDGVVYNADGTQIIGILPTLSGEVRIADGITVIPQQLFADNTSITSVILPNSIKTIEWRAFSGCTSLAQIEFPEGLLTIEDYAFSSTGLTTVVLPSTLTTFGEGVFDGCTKLANIEDKSGKFLKVVDGIVYNVDGTQIIFVLESCTGEVRIAEGVTEIPDFLFSQNERITGVVIPEGVTRIGRQAFEFCTQLQSVVLPESLMEIEEYAFLQCENLTQIRLPESLRTIGTKAFMVSGLTSVVLPEGLTQLGDEVFSVCEDLTSVVLPSTLTSMGEGVFNGCNQLIQIEDESGKTVKTMDGIVYRADGTQIVAVLVSAPEELHIAEGVTEISFGPFYNNSRITGIVVPESVAAIGEYAFRECENLNSILLPSSLNSIGKEAFPPAAVIRSEPDAYARTWAQENGYVWQCAQHGEAVIAEPAVPATRKRTGMTAKLQCSVCGAVLAEPEVIPVFDGKVMKLPAALKSVQRETFLNLPAECFVLPDGCLVIGEKAFADCKMLKLVEIPASVVAIADDAFEGCENVLIVTPEGSAAERYAQRHGILVTSDDP